MLRTTSVIGISPKNRTDWFSPGKVNVFSATHPMGVALVTGCIKHLIQLHTHTHWLSCLFQHGQTPDGFMTTSTRSMKSASFVVG